MRQTNFVIFNIFNCFNLQGASLIVGIFKGSHFKVFISLQIVFALRLLTVKEGKEVEEYYGQFRKLDLQGWAISMVKIQG